MDLQRSRIRGIVVRRFCSLQGTDSSSSRDEGGVEIKKSVFLCESSLSASCAPGRLHATMPLCAAPRNMHHDAIDGFRAGRLNLVSVLDLSLDGSRWMHVAKKQTGAWGNFSLTEVSNTFLASSVQPASLNRAGGLWSSGGW